MKLNRIQKKVLLIGFALFLSFFPAQVNANTLADGEKAYRLGDFDKAFQIFTSLAQEGDASAQNNLGVMYKKGRGVPQDYNEALKWYTKSAEQGNANAQNNLGIIYDEGKGVPQDYREAVKWYKKSAEQGYAIAQYNLGIMYAEGQGVPQDYKEAVKWFTKSAEQGLAEAQHNLGVMYAYGQGVPQDNVIAYVWFNLAASKSGASGTDNAKDLRDLIKMIRTPSQIEQGQKLSREWLKNLTSQKNNFLGLQPTEKTPLTIPNSRYIYIPAFRVKGQARFWLPGFATILLPT